MRPLHKLIILLLVLVLLWQLDSYFYDRDLERDAEICLIDY